MLTAPNNTESASRSATNLATSAQGVAPVQRQRTVGQPAGLTGVALHNGKQCTVRLLPAGINDGVVFVRIDLPDKPRITGVVQNISHRQRRTALAIGDAEVHMVEHLMSVLRAFAVDNVIVEVDSDELPGCDGSALDYVDLVDRAGIVELDAPRKVYVLDRIIEIQEAHANLVALPPIDGEFQIFYTLDYEQHPLLKGFLDYTLEPDTFRQQIAPARTFVMEKEALMLQKMGFGLGANTDNTLVVGDNGPIDNELRFGDEYVRHKVLDVIGDLSLLGCDLRARIVSTRSGHLSNLKLVQKLAEELARVDRPEAGAGAGAARPNTARVAKNAVPASTPSGSTGSPNASSSGNGSPVVVVTAQPEIVTPPDATTTARPTSGSTSNAVSLDIREILRILPHRFPFVLVDRILELEPGKRAVGIKNVTINEPFFQGHFPQAPIMPGVMLIEAMAQLGGLTLINHETNTGKFAVLTSLEKVRFRRTVTPGDQLLMEVDVRRQRAHTGEVSARATVAGKVAGEAQIRYMIVDPRDA